MSSRSWAPIPRGAAWRGRAVLLAFALLAAAPSAHGQSMSQVAVAQDPVDAGVVTASPAPAPVDPDLARLLDGHSQRSNWKPPGLTDRYGHAEVLVAAPIARVRRMALDFGHYRELTGGRFHVSKVVAKEENGTDVYFQIPILEGMITLWQVFRFQELKPLAPGWSIIEGWYVKGNIGRGNAAWTLRAIDETHTLVKFDLLVLPNVPLPQPLIDDGLRNAAAAAVDSLRDRAQETPGPVPYTIPPPAVPAP
ncbi:MAG TPA: SRPBCC family protein [Polyangiaceae bacterium]